MPDNEEPQRPRSGQQPPKQGQPNKNTDNPVEEEPAVERGERLATSKRIARSGSDKGFVPGATPQK